MAAITKFEEIESWKKGRELCRRLYELTVQGPFSRDFGLRDQMRRAAVSIVSNIAEGFERDSGDRDFRHFLGLAKGSAGELRSQLYIALDAGYLTESEFQELFKLVSDVSVLIRRFMVYLESSVKQSSKVR